ncbi:hypothetical protein CPB85DRAFT_1264456, partial [Mucidula mucida]
LTWFVVGLEYLRLAGFVHCDISPGNCLTYNGQTNISDLEYARPMLPRAMVPPRSRTFTPVQIKQHKTAILRLNHMLLNFLLDVSAQCLVLMQNCATNMHSAYGKVVVALTAVHGVDSKLLKALDSFKTLSTCYRIVESSQPLLAESPQATHWDRKVFLHKFYEAIYFYFMDAHEQMKDKNDRARPLREAKRRAQPTAVFPRGRKRQRMCTDNEACVPPLWEEQDEKSDSEAPPEETQLGKNKRNRGIQD